MKTLEQLIQQLTIKVQQKAKVNIFELFPLVKAYANNDWETSLLTENHKPKNTLLYHDEQLKVILIHWNSFQKSSKHGHPGGGGLLKVLSGTLIESLFDPQNTEMMTGKHRYTAGDIAFIHDDIAHHIVENPKRTSAVSLHIYSPALYVPGFAPATIPQQRFKLRTAA